VIDVLAQAIPYGLLTCVLKSLNLVTRLVIAITIRAILHYRQDGFKGILHVTIKHIYLMIALIFFFQGNVIDAAIQVFLGLLPTYVVMILNLVTRMVIAITIRTFPRYDQDVVQGNLSVYSIMCTK
jgi:mannose/fructose/N-acetylgalactosamine-specific phosphotransferase system component IIC